MQNSGFFNGDAEYGQEEFNRYFQNLYESGVSIDENGKMTLGVSVKGAKAVAAPGFAVLEGFYYHNDADLELEITPDADYPRIDRIVVRVNKLTGPAEIVVKKGTAASSPKAPVLQRDKNVFEISLAKVAVSPGGALKVTDERFDSSVCGALRPRNMTEYKDMVKEFQKQFETWFDAQQSKGWTKVYNQAGEPKDSVVGSIWI